MRILVKSDLIKQSMLVNGFNISVLANQVNVGVSYMSQILNGKRNPSPKLAKRIADALGVEITDIFTIEINKEAN